MSKNKRLFTSYQQRIEAFEKHIRSLSLLELLEDYFSDYSQADDYDGVFTKEGEQKKLMVEELIISKVKELISL